MVWLWLREDMSCAGYEVNYDKLHDTRPDAEDPEKNKEKKTTADVT